MHFSLFRWGGGVRGELMREFYSLPHKPLSPLSPVESASSPAPAWGVGRRIILGVWPQIGRARPLGAGVVKGEVGRDVPRKSVQKNAESCEGGGGGR